MRQTLSIPVAAWEALRAAIPPEAILETPAACYEASFDNARFSVLPEAVIRPPDEAAIEAVLRIANAYRVPITPRGAGSATTGAATPVCGGWVLDFTSWQALRIDALTGMAYAQPGVVTAVVQQQAAAQGWFYPPDPSSVAFSTLGGNVVTNAGGLRAAKYGVTRDYILALEGFLPTGEKVRWGADVRKYASGYNLRDLWIGSEGTLGVITQIVLKLIPAPCARHTFLAAFSDEIQALRAVKALAQARVVPSILEFMDGQTVACTHQHTGKTLFAQAPDAPLLLIEIDGHPAALAAERAQILQALSPLALGLHETACPAEAESFWEVRRACSRAMFAMGNTKLNEDIVVPLRSQEALIEFTQLLRRQTGLPTPTFGHVADGNFHVHLMYDGNDPDQVKRAAAGVDALMKQVIALGGVITGEHGIGLTKAAYLRYQHTPQEVAAMRAIKKALDPNDILNPGKIFEPFPTFSTPRIISRRPWEKE